MDRLKFLHVADLHIDSPLRGLELYDHAPSDKIRRATRQALENLVQLALDQRVAFVLVAGDLYDGDWPDYNTGLFVVRQLARLHEAGIPVVMISGNHDAQNKMTKALRLPDNVRVLQTDRPETLHLEAFDVAIHGQGFATPAVLNDLSVAYPPATSGCFNIGLLHTCASGRDGHQRYAPCTLEGLRSKQYDYWALGHIHKREILCQDDPWVVFPGNTQGRHIRESGPKGCMLVTVDARRNIATEFQPLSVLRWEHCLVDATGANSDEDLLTAFTAALQSTTADCDGLPVAVRVEIVGQCGAHKQIAAQPEKWTNELRSAASGASGGLAWVEKVKLHTTLPDEVRENLAVDSPLGALWEVFDEYQADDDKVRALAAELADLRLKLPAELREGPDALGLDDPQQLRETLEDVRHMLLGKLLAQGSKL